MKIQIVVLGVPPIVQGEAFVFMLKELFELKQSDNEFETVKRVAAQHSEAFEVRLSTFGIEIFATACVRLSVEWKRSCVIWSLCAMTLKRPLPLLTKSRSSIPSKPRS